MKQIIFFLLMLFPASQALAANMVQQFQLPASSSQFVFTATTTSTAALNANQNRGYLMIQNSCASTDIITVALRNIEAGGDGVQVQPCGSYEFLKIPTNSVWIKAASGTQSVIIIEGNVAFGETQ